jgi:hypothetical protein
MKRRLLASLIAVVLLLSVLLAGCQSDGIAQDLYDSAVEQLNNAQGTVDQLQDEVDDLKAAKESVEEDMQAAAATIAELQAKVSGMTGQYELTGATTLETVTNIIEYYHDTHVYSKADLFVCSDMASEVWSMLKAQGINALIVVGDKNKAISDIIQSDHAWLLAEVEPGIYLALETTAGYAIYENENPLYYQGWFFNSPGDMKSYNNLVKEYNVRVEVINQLIAEDQIVVAEHNQTTNPTEAAELKAVHDMLEELIHAQEAELLSIEAEINSLATILR